MGGGGGEIIFQKVIKGGGVRRKNMLASNIHCFPVIWSVCSKVSSRSYSTGIYEINEVHFQIKGLFEISFVDFSSKTQYENSTLQLLKLIVNVLGLCHIRQVAGVLD